MKHHAIWIPSLGLFSLLLITIAAFINACGSSPSAPAGPVYLYEIATPTFTYTPCMNASPTPSPCTPTDTFTPTDTSTPTNTHTSTYTPTITFTPTLTFTATNSPTPTQTRTPTNSPTITPTSTPSNTATNSPTVTQTPTPTKTPTNTATNSPCMAGGTPCTSTLTQTSTPVFSYTPTRTPTPVPTLAIDPSIYFSNYTPIGAQEGAPVKNNIYGILAANPGGGAGAPYYFQAGSFVDGAPPLGTSVGLNGYLTGTPSGPPGRYIFDVCAVDVAGHGNCQPVTVDVGAVTVNSITQTLGTKYDVGCGSGSTYEWINLTIHGTVDGPVGTYFYPDIAGATCPNWTWDSGNQGFYRAIGQPESAAFTETEQYELYSCNSDSTPTTYPELDDDGNYFENLNQVFTVYWQ